MKLSDEHDFRECLQDGVEWEERLKPKLKEQIMAINVKQISFDEDPAKQLSGIDQVLTQATDLNIDVKVRDHEYYGDDVLLETVSVVEEGIPGWFWEADSDLVVWVYPNKAKTNLHKTGYLMPLTDGLRDWVDQKAEEFRYIQTQTTGRYGEYHTGCRLVPIDDFPDEYLVEFDPRLPTARETPQSDIMKWASENADSKTGQTKFDAGSWS